MRPSSFLAVAAATLSITCTDARAAGGWVWPLRGPVITAYANDNARPYAGGMHRGIDIGAAVGTPVGAAHAGSVTYAGRLGRSGLTVAVANSGGRHMTSYLHLDEIAVARGERLEAGARVGTVGTSGKRSTEQPHLHFGVRLADRSSFYVDPLSLLGPLSAPAAVAAAVVPAVPSAEPVRAQPAPVRVRAAAPAVRAPSRAPARVPARVRTRVPRGQPAPRGAPRHVPDPVVTGRSRSPAPLSRPERRPSQAAERHPVLQPLPALEPAGSHDLLPVWIGASLALLALIAFARPVTRALRRVRSRLRSRRPPPRPTRTPTPVASRLPGSVPGPRSRVVERRV